MDLLYPPRRRPDQPPPRSKGRKLAAIAVTSVVLLAALLMAMQPGGVLGPPAPPRAIRHVTLVYLEASVGLVATNATNRTLTADPPELPHCSEGYFYGGALHYYGGRYGGAFNRSADNYVILDYHEYGSTFTGLGSDMALFELGAAGVTIFAALNQTTPLYTVRSARPVTLDPAPGVELADQSAHATYVVNGTFHNFRSGTEDPGSYLVKETHEWEVHRYVPLFLHEAAPCI